MPDGPSEIPAEGVFWRSSRPSRELDRLEGRQPCDIAIVGGGIAGLSAAQWLLENAGPLSVALLEAETCGAGASGKSSGFITPDSEMEFKDLGRRFGETGPRLWAEATRACDWIRENIRRFDIDCGFIEADSVYAATSSSGARDVEEEHEARLASGLPSRLYADPRKILGSDSYTAALRYPGTFAIDPFAYVQGLRDSLVSRGVRIFEKSRVTRVDEEGAHTVNGSLRASGVIVALDRFTPELGFQANSVYHAQTGLLISEPLEASLIRSLFPDGPLLVWDTKLIYDYLRPTPDHRLLVGGGLLRKTYANGHPDDAALPRHILSALWERFPQTRDMRFVNWWSGLIGVSKDLLPIAGCDPDRPWLSYAICSAGLPWSTLAGRLAAKAVVEGPSGPSGLSAEGDPFRPDRTFTELDLAQPFIGKRATFALSNYYAKKFLKGSASAVRRRMRGFAAVAGALAVGAAARALGRSRRKPRRRS